MVNGPPSTVRGLPSVVHFAYNGLGDRLQQTMNGQTTTYTLDLTAGLTQVLAEGANTYLYGVGRIAQLDTATQNTAYFLGDALGSVRQVVDKDGQVLLAKGYSPFGEVMYSLAAPVSGEDAATSAFGYTGEQADGTGLVYLRARYYDPATGRFVSKGCFPGYLELPASQHPYVYGLNSPLRYTDPTGHNPAVAALVVVGAFAGGLIGALSSYAYANWIYSLAEGGHCGCEGLLLRTVYTREEFVRQVVTLGTALGAVMGMLPGFGDEAAFAMALTMVVLSSYGVTDAMERLEADPTNGCAWLDLSISLLGLAGATWGAYRYGVRLGIIPPVVIVPVGELEAVSARLGGLISEMRNALTQEEFEAVLGARGVSYEVGRSMEGMPMYRLRGYALPVEIRLKLAGNSTTIEKFRVGVRLYGASPINQFTVNPADRAVLESLDRQLLELYGEPTGEQPLRPNQWPGRYIDVFGNVYLDTTGKVNGLRTEAVHFGPYPK